MRRADSRTAEHLSFLRPRQVGGLRVVLARAGLGPARELGAADDEPVHLVRTVGQPQRALAAYMSASGVHCETPVAPCIWIASSMIWQTRSGTIALTVRPRRALRGCPARPSPWRPSAPSGASPRSRCGPWRSISMFLPRLMIGLPNASRVYRAWPSGRARARPGRSSACSGGCGRGRAGPARSRSRGLRRAGCSPSARARPRSGCACGRAARRRGRTRASGRGSRRPGVSVGTRICDCCRCGGASGLVFTIRS